MPYEQYTYKTNPAAITNQQIKGKAQFVDNRDLSVLQRKQKSVIQRAAILLLNPSEIADKNRINDLMLAAARLNSGDPFLGTLINKKGMHSELFPMHGMDAIIENQDNIDILGHSYKFNKQHRPGALNVNTLAQLIQNLPFRDKANWNGSVRIYSCQTGKPGPATQDYIMDLLTTIRGAQLPNALSVLGSTENVQHLPDAPPIKAGTLRLATADLAQPSQGLNYDLSINPMNFQRPRTYLNPLIPENIISNAASHLRSICIKRHQKMINKRQSLDNKKRQTQVLQNSNINNKLREFRVVIQSNEYTSIEKAFTPVTTVGAQQYSLEMHFYTLDALCTLFSDITDINKQLKKIEKSLDKLIQNIPISPIQPTPIVRLPPLGSPYPQQTPTRRIQPNVARRPVPNQIPITRPHIPH